MKSLSMFCALALCASVGLAQVGNGPDQKQKKTPPPQIDAETTRVALDNAKALGRNGNVIATEQALTALNRAKPNTAFWHIETAQRLIHTAEQLARDGQPGHVGALVRRALQNLTQAEALAKDDATRASAKSLAGFVHERYLADRDAALASYRGAAALSPENSVAAAKAKEAEDRLKNTDDEVKNRVGQRIK